MFDSCWGIDLPVAERRYRAGIEVSSALQTVIRVGVVACVAAACLIGAGRLDSALAVFDFQADANSAATYNDRTYPQIAELPGAAKVMEDARLWMPADAAYGVLYGSRHGELREGPLRYFLRVLLSPRTQSRRESAPWVFCYGCTQSVLAAKLEVLSDSGHGFVFARRKS
jgi:hypothetical protein